MKKFQLLSTFLSINYYKNLPHLSISLLLDIQIKWSSFSEIVLLCLPDPLNSDQHCFCLPDAEDLTFSTAGSLIFDQEVNCLHLQNSFPKPAFSIYLNQPWIHLLMPCFLVEYN